MTRCLAILCLASAALAQPRLDQHGDPLPEGVIARFGSVRYRIGLIGSTAISADGKILATESSRYIVFWDVETGRPIRQIPIPGYRTDDGRFFTMAFSPDGKWFVRTYEKELTVWETATGRERYRIALPRMSWNVGFVSGSSRVAVTHGVGKASICDVVEGKHLTTLEAHCDVHIVAPSGQRLIGFNTAGWHLVDAATGQQVTRFGHPTTSYAGVATSPGDTRAYGMTPTGRLLIFDAMTGEKLEQIAPPSEWNESGDIRLCLSPDGNVAYVWNACGPTSRCELKTGRWLEPLPKMSAGRLIPHPDGKRVLFAGRDGLLHRYDLNTLREIDPPPGFSDPVLVYPSPNGRRLVIHTDRGEETAVLCDDGGRPIASIPIPSGCIAVAWSRDCKFLACAGSREITLSDAIGGKTLRTIRPPLKDDQALFECASFDSSGDHLIAPIAGGEEIAIIETKTGGRTTMIPTGDSGRVSISPDGRIAAMSSCGEGVVLFDLRTRKNTGWVDRTFENQSRTKSSFSPDGSYLATWGTSDEVVLRDPVTAQRLRAVPNDQTRCDNIAFSPDGQWLALGDDDGFVTVWDTATATKVRQWEAHRDSIRHVAFAGQGRVVTSSVDLTGLLWDLRPKEKPIKPLWTALAGDDAVEAFRAVWAIADDPKGPELLRIKIAPAKSVDSVKLKQWLADLGADKFAVRETASRELQRLGRLIEPELHDARTKPANEEMLARIESLIHKIPRERSATEIVQARAVAAMEIASNDEAKNLLTEWAAGAPGARLTIDAKAALRRLNGAR
jgi:WD40 repeat protein